MKRSAKEIKAELLQRVPVDVAVLVEELDAARRFAWRQYFLLKNALNKTPTP